MKIISNGKTLEVPSCVSQDIYSLEEQVVGRWIDGKALYKRTFLVQTPSANIERPIFTLENAEFKELRGYFTSGSNANMPLNFNGSGNSYAVIYSMEGNIVCLVGNENYANKPMIVTGLYTKSTDQPTIELPSSLTATPEQALYKAAPQSATAVTLDAGIKQKEV